ncbi:MAG TPA: DUF1343 domain-containing protein [Chloroflexota bacterium]|nr:DUF1343 domain-containing protein [Chloroflexota bacterium]
MANVLTGLDVLAAEGGARLRGQRVGIITTDCAVDREYRDAIAVIGSLPGVTVARLFAAEHGVRGEQADGAPIADGVDPLSGIRVHSIYGPRLWPDGAALADLDAVVFDICDVGARFYTRAATLVYCLRAAAQAGTHFVVLDRPNPIGGVAVEGPSLRPGFESFVGLAGLPVRHGLTLGELARFFNAAENLNANLEVIHVEGWTRATWYDQTSLPWILPSPNLPTLDTAIVYPGTCFVEGCTASEGRGTTRPFEIIGAPGIEPHRFARELNALNLPGVYFRPTYFCPAARKHAGQVCGGVQLHVPDREAFRPVLAGYAVLRALYHLWPEQFAWRPAKGNGLTPIDRLAGGTWLREAVAADADPFEVAETWRADEREFRGRREEWLLY